MYKEIAIWEALTERGKIPRKAKKWAIGKRLSGCEVRRMIRRTVLGEEIRTMYERREAHPHGLFCPKCGVSETHQTHNMASYPEAWYHFYCLRCRFKVAYIDNSPYVHVLEEMLEGRPVPPQNKSQYFARRLRHYQQGGQDMRITMQENKSIDRLLILTYGGRQVGRKISGK